MWIRIKAVVLNIKIMYQSVPTDTCRRIVQKGC